MAPGETAAAGDRARHDELWERLLQFVEDGLVIPVVGQELLSVEIGGQQSSLYEYLARRLAERLSLAAPEAGAHAPLNHVAFTFLGRGGEPERIYSELQRVMKDAGRLAPPESLRKLASIKPFSLFVSTTLDSMLVQALDAERFGGESSTDVTVYSPAHPDDLPDDGEHADRTRVYQLFGSVSAMPDYVVTEEDALEFLHNLLFSARPKRLFTQLQKRQLLILGCSFPTWIVRFLIRASRESRLLLARGKRDLVVDSGTRQDLSLVSFLQAYQTRTEILDTGTAIEFVDELHRRWLERAPTQPGPSRDAADRPVYAKEGVVFISYASEDRTVATGILEALEAAGLDAWLDRHDLRPGDDFERRIRHTIEKCGLFVALLSRSSLKKSRRFLQLEWNCAIAEAEKARPSQHFIIPVVLDDVPTDHPDIPDTFRSTHMATLQNGRLSDETIRSITSDYREFQKRRGGV